MADSLLVKGAGLVAQSEGVGKLAVSKGATKVAAHLSKGLAEVFQKRNREFNSMMKTQLSKEGLTDQQYNDLYKKFKESRMDYVYLNKKGRADAERDLIKDGQRHIETEGALDEISDTISNDENQIDTNDLGTLSEDIKDMITGDVQSEIDENGRVGYTLASDALDHLAYEDEDGNDAISTYIAGWDDVQGEDNSQGRFKLSEDGKHKTDEWGNKYTNDDEGKKKFIRDSKLWWIQEAKKTGNKLLHYDSKTGKREYITPEEAEALLNDDKKFFSIEEIKDHIKGKSANVESNNAIKDILLDYNTSAQGLKSGDSLEFNEIAARGKFEKIITPENITALSSKVVVGDTSWEKDYQEKLVNEEYETLGIDRSVIKEMDPTNDGKISASDAKVIIQAIINTPELHKYELTSYFMRYAKREHNNNIPQELRAPQNEVDSDVNLEDEDEFANPLGDVE